MNVIRKHHKQEGKNHHYKPIKGDVFQPLPPKKGIRIMYSNP